MNIRKATEVDVPEIFNFVEAAISKMISQEIENKLAACFVLNKDCDEEYKNGTWHYIGEDYVVIIKINIPDYQSNCTVGHLE